MAVKDWDTNEIKSFNPPLTYLSTYLSKHLTFVNEFQPAKSTVRWGSYFIDGENPNWADKGHAGCMLLR